MTNIVIRDTQLCSPKLLTSAFFLFMLAACSGTTSKAPLIFDYSIEGKWIADTGSDYMLNPQTSGLAFHRGSLYSISDGSADETQIRRLHKIDPVNSAVTEKLGPFKLSELVSSTCFESYLMSRPDFEGLVAIPKTENKWLTITEDATRAGKLSPECKQKFRNTYSTEHPTLLVKLELINDLMFITGVRALQFKPNHDVGDFPNDGIEGITITRNLDILLGLEKDKYSRARILKVSYSDQMFNVLDEFINVESVDVKLPKFKSGNHPINGMDIYYPNEKSQGYLIAAARNDDQLWVVDLSNMAPTKVINLNFYGPSVNKALCEPTHRIKNTGLEGVAVHEKVLYLINDPWKKVYSDNVVCPSDRQRYEDFAPLLFKLPIKDEWFK